MHDGLTITELRVEMARFTAAFDPELIGATDAARVQSHATAIKNMAATIESLAAARVAATDAWRRDGDASPAHALARKAGTSVGKARQALETGARLGELPALAAAARTGELSADQAAPIAEAATKAPGSEQRLMDLAGRASLGELRDECERTKAAAEPDDEAKEKEIHRRRFARRRTTADGGAEITYHSTRTEVAEMWGIVTGFASRAFNEARRAGRRETPEAYSADGMLDMARAAAAAGGSQPAPPAPPPPPAPPAPPPGPSSPSTPPTTPTTVPREADTPDGDPMPDGPSSLFPDLDETDTAPPAPAPATDDAVTPPVVGARPKVVPPKVIVRVDWDALVRGWPIDGEVCEIAGIGLVPVPAVRAMIESCDVILAAVVTRGTDVVNVAHLGRNPTAFQTTALQWRDPLCAVEGCNRALGRERDHRQDWAHTKVTLLAWLDRLCDHHHDLKTYQGWSLVAGVGKRAMVAPDDDRHPRHACRSRAGPAPPTGT